MVLINLRDGFFYLYQRNGLSSRATVTIVLATHSPVVCARENLLEEAVVECHVRLRERRGVRQQLHIHIAIELVVNVLGVVPVYIATMPKTN